MQPVLAIFAGYSLGGQVVKPGPDLEPYVQEALDEIEYVTGGAEHEVGRACARATGIRRRSSCATSRSATRTTSTAQRTYDGRYAQFYKAIKAKYPELQLIATMPVQGHDARRRGRPLLQARAGHVRRSAATTTIPTATGPKIFVGEWATREGTPTPNLGAALGDAAFMTGLERNSDVVVMSATRRCSST